MCAVARRLAEANGVEISTHVSAAEDLGLPADRKFDVIYTGNTLHHVDIAATMPRLLRHLQPGGIFVSWDPLAYNPAINVYRRRAAEVHTVDEHPLRRADIRAIRGCFQESTTRYFWLSTLLIFIIMAVGAAPECKTGAFLENRHRGSRPVGLALPPARTPRQSSAVDPVPASALLERGHRGPGPQVIHESRRQIILLPARRGGPVLQRGDRPARVCPPREGGLRATGLRP